MLSVNGDQPATAREGPEFDLAGQGLAKTPGPLRATAEALQAMRRRRNQLFPMLGFADPEWSMLLDLYVEHFRSRRTSVTSLSIAAGVPPSTAMRFISSMVDQGILNKCRDRDDARRVFVELSAASLLAMEQLLQPLLFG